MVPMKIRLDNNDHYDGGNTKEYIVIHDTGNQTDSDEGNANYFCTGTRNASAHYFVDNDSMTQVVKDDDCSFHCGDGHNIHGINNRNSLGIEQCRVNGVVTEVTMNNTIDLVKMLMVKYNIPASKVVRHFDASGKNCPASFNLDGKWTKWNEFKARLVAREPKFSTLTYARVLNIGDIGNDVKALQTALNALGFNCGKVDGSFGTYTNTAVRTFQSRNGLAVDGDVGKNTINKLNSLR